jgi:hypothetical protein
MAVRLELTIRLDELPTETKDEPGGGASFVVGTEPGPRFAVKLNKKTFTRMKMAAEQWPHWLAIIAGKPGKSVGDGVFRLEEIGANIMERKKPEPTQARPKPSKSAKPEAPKPAKAKPPPPPKRPPLPEERLVDPPKRTTKEVWAASKRAVPEVVVVRRPLGGGGGDSGGSSR